MGVLLLVRHGQASLGTGNYDRLSELGQRQARATGARLARADLAVHYVVCGALVRQRDTATVLMAEMGMPESHLRIDERLDEYDHVGIMAAYQPGVSFETAATAQERQRIQPALDEAIVRWAAADDGTGTGYPESHGAFMRRVFDATHDLTGRSGSTLAVTSGGVIAAICAERLGLPADRWPGLARLLVNASVTKLITGPTGTQLLSFNDHAHLESDRTMITYR
jgi:broad specificity phosphatase PhoE